MSVSRRDFVKSASATIALTAIGTRDALATAPEILVRTQGSAPDFKELAHACRRRREGRPARSTPTSASRSTGRSPCRRASAASRASSDNETAGIGVRALVNGAWGFAATADLTPDAVAAHRAAARWRRRKANRAALARPIVLAPYGAAQTGAWRAPIKIDPFDDPDRRQGRAAARGQRSGAQGARRRASCNSGVIFLREEKSVRQHRRLVHRADALSLHRRT